MLLTPSLRTATSLALAVTLLAVAVAPPAVRHAHSVDEGGGSHSHSGEDARAETHGDSQHGHGHEWHLHVSFLGLEITLPDRVPNRGNDESGAQTEVVLLASRTVVTAPSLCCEASLAGTLSAPSQPSLDDAVAMQFRATAPPPVSVAPLCDAARRERTGVLLT